MIGIAICGSFCSHAKITELFKTYSDMNTAVQPIFSDFSYKTSTRFGEAADFVAAIEEIAGRKAIHTIEGSEPLGPATPLDALIIAPCTGNTLAKLASGITDTTVTMAAKAHLRNNRPLIIALFSNDALSANLTNIGHLLGRKNIYFVPMYQDDIIRKPYSLVANLNLVPEAHNLAMKGEQLQPVFLGSASRNSE
ncbi:dipicolinate synthase subunit B [Clostridia bacterium]|nr:dipicolinate synthase subunit B [Clostridia bacterium]